MNYAAREIMFDAMATRKVDEVRAAARKLSGMGEPGLVSECEAWIERFKANEKATRSARAKMRALRRKS